MYKNYIVFSVKVIKAYLKQSVSVIFTLFYLMVHTN